MHHTVALQLPKLLGQHFGADIGNDPSDFAETQRAVLTQVEQDNRLPFAPDDLEG